MTPDELDLALTRVLARLDDLVQIVSDAAYAAATAEHAFKVAYAKERVTLRVKWDDMNGKISIPAVDDLALTTCEKEHLAHLIAANGLTSAREALKATTARLDGLRTLSAAMRGAGA